MPRARAETKPADPIAAIEAEIAALEAKKAALTERLPTLEAAKAAALDRRREALIDGAGTQAEADAHRAAREAESGMEAVADALAEVERRLADGVERLAKARDQLVRDTIADELERDTRAVDAAAREVQDAVAALVRAKESLENAITPLIAARTDEGWLAPLPYIANVLFGRVLANGIPNLKIESKSVFHEGGWVNGKDLNPRGDHVDDPIGAILTDRLRQLAADIRAGTASPDLSRWIGYREPEEPDFTPLYQRPFIYVRERFSYLDEGGVPVNVEIGRPTLPMPLAEHVVATGHGSWEQPRSWIADPRGGFGSGVSQFPMSGRAPDIGFSLEDWIEAETEKARAAWHAANKRTAA